jgi:predicted PurR-regulated permease PerM
MEEIINAINQYGVPTVVAVGMSYFIFYIWKYVTGTILPSLSQASTTLIGLIDRIRMLDNDMIRLDQKINTIIEIQDQQNDPFASANQKRKDAAQDFKIVENAEKIEAIKEKS